MKIYIGTYTKDILSGAPTGSKGIYLCGFDEKSGKLEILETDGHSANPSFLHLSGDGTMLLAVNELLSVGALDTYALGANGTLKHIDKVRFSGNACCYASLPEDKSFAIAVHYGEGEVFAYKLENGRFAGRTFSYTGSGSGPAAQRQEGPHAHSVRLLSATQTAVVCDLGCDRVSFFRYRSGGQLSPCEPFILPTPAGSGPRHSEFTAGGERLYISCELSSETLYYQRTETGYQLRQRISTLPEDFGGTNTAADIHFGLDQKHLYVSNRGHDSVVCYSIDRGGFLRCEGHAGCGGKTPRNLAVFEKHIICANQDSGNVAVLELLADGRVGGQVAELRIPASVCVEKAHTRDGGMIP